MGPNMKRIALSDGSGHWFDIDAAKSWKESVDDNERDRRDREDPQEEKLYLTSNGSFVSYHWSWNMRDGLYFPMDQEKATRWLIANGFQSEIPKLDLRPEERQLEV